jgi:MFS family permease
MATPTRRTKVFGIFPKFRGWWIVAVGFLGLYLHGSATSYLFALLIVPMETDLGWSRTTLVGALTVATFVSGGAGLVLGPIFDRHGVRFGMTLSALLGGTFMLLLAAMSAPWQLYLLFGVGLGVTRVGLENVGPRTAIANWFVRRRAAAFAWFSGGRALFGATLLVPIAVMVDNTSWRSGWIAIGALEIAVLAPLAWLVVRRRPEDVGQLPDGDEPGMGSASGTASDDDGLSGGEIQWTRGEAARTRSFWYMTAAFVLVGFPATGIIANIMPYMQGSGLSLVAASWAFSMYGYGAILGRPLWGYVAARFGVRLGLTAFGISYGITIAAFVIADSTPTLFAAAFPLGTVIGGIQQLQSQAWPDYFGRRHAGAIAGLTTLLIMPAMATGPLIAAFAFGVAGSYTLVFSAYAAACFAAGLFFFLAKPPVGRPG